MVLRKENNMMKQKPIVYSIAEVAQLLDISRSYAYKLVQQGELPVLDIGTRRVIPKAYLDEWIREKVKENQRENGIARDKILENRIHKRQDGRWCLVYLPDAPDSKRRYIYGKTKKEVIGKVEKLEEAADNAASSREDTEKIIFKYRKRRVKQQDLQAESAIVPDSDVSEEKS